MASRGKVEFNEVAIMRRIHFNASAGVREAAQELADNYSKLIRTGSRSGRHYRENPNQSSAPGEPPKTQTGELAGSVEVHMTGRSGSLQGKVVINAPYAAELEYGTEEIEPRPALVPLMNKARRRYRETIMRRLMVDFR